jgi:tRNA pseudouridine55 synthase
VSPNGILFVDKVEGWTSHDVVARSRRALGTKKVGHAGTLDPMATGLLTLGVGPSTRLLTYMVGLDKTYTTTIRLGATTVTDDREGELLFVCDPALLLGIDAGAINAAAAPLTGSIMQSPSSVSAIKVDGRRAYDRVRAGEEVSLPGRPVTVHAFTLGEPRAAFLETGEPVIDVDATVRCSSGTYVRALARDLGATLGVGGHLTALRRTEVGPFSVEEAISHELLVSGEAPALHQPADIAATLFPVLSLDEQQAIDLAHGKSIAVPANADAATVAAIGPDGRLIGLVKIRRGSTRVIVNFPTSGGVA